MILLDTNAIIWIIRNHPRARALIKQASPLRISPVSILELQVLADGGRLRVDRRDVLEDDRWQVDDPPALEWFTKAAEESWTRDPFDRLIVAHAHLRRYRLATGDAALLDRLRPSERFEL